MLAEELRPLLLHLNRDLRREALPMGATVGQIALLAAIREEPGIGVRDLATRERMSAPAMSGYVDRLEAAGLVVRRRHPEDGRGVLAEITETGRSLVEGATAELVGADFGLGALDDDGLRDLSALLRPIRQSAGDF